jgi:hypothetical protein
MPIQEPSTSETQVAMTEEAPATFSNEDEPTVYDPMSAPLRFCPDLAEYLWESSEPADRR